MEERSRQLAFPQELEEPTLDANGARELAKRIEAHEHWRQAEAVRGGEQPAVDPDLAELEELGEGVRRYGLETQRADLGGARALVARRLCKRIVDGRWQVLFEVERVDYLDDPATAAS